MARSRTYVRDSRGRFASTGGGGGGKGAKRGRTELIRARRSVRQARGKLAAFDPADQSNKSALSKRAQRGAVTRAEKRLAAVRKTAVIKGARVSGTISKKRQPVMRTTPMGNNRVPASQRPGSVTSTLRETLRTLAQLDAKRIRELEAITGQKLTVPQGSMSRKAKPQSGSVAGALRETLRTLAQSDARMARETDAILREATRKLPGGKGGGGSKRVKGGGASSKALSGAAAPAPAKPKAKTQAARRPSAPKRQTAVQRYTDMQRRIAAVGIGRTGVKAENSRKVRSRAEFYSTSLFIRTQGRLPNFNPSATPSSQDQLTKKRIKKTAEAAYGRTEAAKKQREWAATMGGVLRPPAISRSQRGGNGKGDKVSAPAPAQMRVLRGDAPRRIRGARPAGTITRPTARGKAPTQASAKSTRTINRTRKQAAARQSKQAAKLTHKTLLMSGPMRQVISRPRVQQRNIFGGTDSVGAGRFRSVGTVNPTAEGKRRFRPG